MEELLARTDDIIFEVETALEEQIGALNLPFPGMDKSGAAVCIAHLRGDCPRGLNCPFRHIKGDRSVVCKHWLRGLCKKGDLCEFLHEFDASKMPECYFYSRFHACSNKECPFLHIDPESKIKDCPWYDRGFCRHGPNCRHRHTRRLICLCYLAGFCPLGPECKFVHPRFDLPINDPTIQTKKGTVICHYCNESGHKIYNCPKMTPEAREEAIQSKLFSMKQHPGQQLPHHSHHNSHHSNHPSHSNHSNHHHHHQPHSNHPNHQHPHQNQNHGPSPNFIKKGGPPPINADDSEDAQGGKERVHRPLDQVTCYKCGERGHYANKCPKGHLAFLSSALKELQAKRSDPKR
ncbi:cleavage and polyadenylation specificity factor subunit 4-like [Panonychus citri]|uniref:cleavage and polyadenylation specificity factor subunit 4-like n=1 Tax=Panonychus citri TaxID=50023 RepID=UPI002307C57C|nr:cleavage and polyadenylation specificity factor subunit 4-like [Panonychus citri]